MLISKEKWFKTASELELRLFALTLTHPFFGRFIEFLDVDTITKMSNPDFYEATDNGDWKNPQTLKLDDLFKDMLERGMRDPLFVGVGLDNSMMRLETGNQRVQIFKKNGIKFLPVIAYVGSGQISHTGNGVHSGVPAKLVKDFGDFMGPYTLKHFDLLSSIVKM